MKEKYPVCWYRILTLFPRFYLIPLKGTGQSYSLLQALHVLSSVMIHWTLLALGNAMHGLTSPLLWLEMIEKPQNEVSSLLMQNWTLGSLLYCGSKRGVFSELPKKTVSASMPVFLGIQFKIQDTADLGKMSLNSLL